MSMAFRHVPMLPLSWHLLILKAAHPKTGEVFYFIDKCLPSGSLISCMIFQEFSNSVAHLVRYKTDKPLVNYLDDYYFVDFGKILCDGQVHIFLRICEAIRFPVSLEKTEWGASWQIFLGMLIDAYNQIVGIPKEKVAKALSQINYFLTKKNKKVTVLEVQQLCGTLNFISRAIVPGRAFTRRLYAMATAKSGKVKLMQYHHIRITGENKLDLQVWKRMLESPSVFSRPFLSDDIMSAIDLDMYSDTAKSDKKGFGTYYGTEWIAHKWPRGFLQSKNPSIEYLELYGVTTVILLWAKNYRNQKICSFTDNESVKNMVNNTTSGCKNCMILICLIVLESMESIFVKFVRSKENAKADALSRLQFVKFRRLAPNMSNSPMEMPQEIWPTEKIWMD